MIEQNTVLRSGIIILKYIFSKLTFSAPVFAFSVPFLILGFVYHLTTLVLFIPFLLVCFPAHYIILCEMVLIFCLLLHQHYNHNDPFQCSLNMYASSYHRDIYLYIYLQRVSACSLLIEYSMAAEEWGRIKHFYLGNLKLFQ